MKGFHDGWMRGIPPSILSNEAQPNGAVFLGVQQVHKWGQWGQSPSSTLRIIHIPCRMTLPPGSSCQLCPGGRTRVGEWKSAEVSLFLMFFYMYCGFNLHALITSLGRGKLGLSNPKSGHVSLSTPPFHVTLRARSHRIPSSVQDWKSSMPFKRDLALPNIIPPFKMQPQIAKWRRHLMSSI